ncbi:MAG TPA: DUF6600 domain-containing protein [Ideonella sp.]|uniref:DUF6600 domain-containing protein n=1 Tax=Ideonella sp. TaxID=1929293 RepID=UPI002BFB9365|nr:DUF6600 domain-containing protein [Ideonella sp.]HSI49143.1 DUF6600 domain-containing protein [Ideonella sp.]
MLALWMAAAPAAQAEDDPPGRVGRVAQVHGQAWMQEQGQREWFDLQRNRPFTTGDRLTTDRDSRMELQIGSTTVRLDERTDLQIERLDDDRVDLRLYSGSAILRVREPELIREVSLNTREGSYLPRSTGLFRVDAADDQEQASVLSGELQFNGDSRSVALRTGQRAILSNEGRGPLALSWGAPADDDFERWALYEDGREPPRAEQQRYPVSPEMTGAEDLAGQGNWETHPEYGAIWTPTVVQADWAPYRYGRWIWVAPWGWTWQDDAAWGFAPFHYGRWVNWRGRWGWAPGQYVRRPVYAPAMVGWVGGSGPGWSVSVSVGGGPVVGWVPLAPREVFVPYYRYSPRYVQNINYTHVHLPPNYQPPRQTPGAPVMYTNRGVPGGITAVPSAVMFNRQPVGGAQRVPDAVVGRVVREPGHTVALAAPPQAPAQAMQPPPSARQPNRPVVTPLPGAGQGRPWAGRPVAQQPNVQQLGGQPSGQQPVAPQPGERPGMQRPSVQPLPSGQPNVQAVPPGRRPQPQDEDNRVVNRRPDALNAHGNFNSDARGDDKDEDNGTWRRGAQVVRPQAPAQQPERVQPQQAERPQVQRLPQAVERPQPVERPQAQQPQPQARPQVQPVPQPQQQPRAEPAERQDKGQPRGRPGDPRRDPN